MERKRRNNVLQKLQRKVDNAAWKQKDGETKDDKENEIKLRKKDDTFETRKFLKIIRCWLSFLKAEEAGEELNIKGEKREDAVTVEYCSHYGKKRGLQKSRRKKWRR